MSETPPTALTIAGSDSGGGAGAQADLKTFAAHGVHGTCALTAVTAQNTTEVRGLVAMDPAFVRLQIETVLADFAVGAAKTGMLATAGVVSEVAAMADAGSLPPLVVDPVLVSSSGHQLMEPAGVTVYLEQLLPLALVATPNLRETAILTGIPLEELAAVEARVAAAEQLRSGGADWVVVKGGHLAGSADDVVAGPDGTRTLAGERVDTPNDHGTGCSLSAAVAAHLSRGAAVPEALEAAKSFVTKALRGGARWRLGAGHGPLDPFGWSSRS